MQAMMSERDGRDAFLRCVGFDSGVSDIKAEHEARRILAETEPPQSDATAYDVLMHRPAVRRGARRWEGDLALADSLAWFLAADVATIAEMQR